MNWFPTNLDSKQNDGGDDKGTGADVISGSQSGALRLPEEAENFDRKQPRTTGQKPRNTEFTELTNPYISWTIADAAFSTRTANTNSMDWQPGSSGDRTGPWNTTDRAIPSIKEYKRLTEAIKEPRSREGERAP